MSGYRGRRGSTCDAACIGGAHGEGKEVLHASHREDKEYGGKGREGKEALPYLCSESDSWAYIYIYVYINVCV